MGSLGVAKITSVGLVATYPSGILTPYTYTLRNTGPDDVYIQIYHCGVCHSNLHQIKDDLGMSNYPMVPGHEVVDEVLEVGSNVTKFSVGEIVRVGLLVGCREKNAGLVIHTLNNIVTRRYGLTMVFIANPSFPIWFEAQAAM
ncbi:unnamed protein product [Lathyrus sativus]|nr:unnamed protein product [Lathyrus sativus]